MSDLSPEPVPPVQHSRFRVILSGFRNTLLAGVVVAIPLVVTIWVLNLAYRFIQGISDPILRKVVLVEADRVNGIAQKTLGDLPGVSFVVTIILLLLLGFVSTNVIGQQMLQTFERLLLRIPIVATVYAGVKQVIDSFKSFNSGTGFKRVVYVDYPAAGCRLIGFVTGQFSDARHPRGMTAVFLPTAPNPMTGFVMVIDSDKLVESGLTLEEATKLIVSAGLVVPRHLAPCPVVAGRSVGQPLTMVSP